MTLCLLKPLHSEEKRTKIPRSFSLHLFSSQLGQEKDQEIAQHQNQQSIQSITFHQKDRHKICDHLAFLAEASKKS